MAPMKLRQRLCASLCELRAPAAAVESAATTQSSETRGGRRETRDIVQDAWRMLDVRRAP
jgi:hypothetical protein